MSKDKLGRLRAVQYHRVYSRYCEKDEEEKTNRLREYLSSPRWCLRCGKKAIDRLRRGLCRECYSAMHYLVKEGLETWERLVNEGLALRSKVPITPREQRVEKIIRNLINEGIYPSASKICDRLQRCNSSLNRRECTIRTRVLTELGIIKRNSTAWRKLGPEIQSHEFGSSPISD